MRWATRRGLLQGGIAGLALCGLAGRVAAEEPVPVAALFPASACPARVEGVRAAVAEATAAGRIACAFAAEIPDRDYAAALLAAAEGGARLILGEAFGHERQVREVARAAPGAAFLVASGHWPDPAQANLSVFDRRIEDATYLAGLAAGAVCTGARIGIVTGYPVAAVNRAVQAFMAGARETSPAVEFLVISLRSWLDPVAAGQAARSMIASGAGLIFAERNGAEKAALDAGLPAFGTSGGVAARAGWDFAPALTAALAVLSAGQFGAADYARWSTLAEAGVSFDLSPGTRNALPGHVTALLDRREAAIRSRSFAVPCSECEPG
ncbi:MAG: BMP family ABC transporter substrate-binding protein [Paracoccaceae bacterium]